MVFFSRNSACSIYLCSKISMNAVPPTNLLSDRVTASAHQYALTKLTQLAATLGVCLPILTANRIFFFSAMVLSVCGFIFALTKDRIDANNARNTLNSIQTARMVPALIILITLYTITNVMISSGVPVWGWDALNFWVAESKVLESKSIDVDSWNHRHPATLPAFFSYLSEAKLGLAYHLAIYAQLSSLVALYSIGDNFKARVGPALAILIYLFSMPLINNHIAVFGYADLHQAIALAALLYWLYEFRDKRQFWMILPLVMVIWFSGSIKNISIPFTTVFIFIYLSFSISPHVKVNTKLLSTLIVISLAGLAVLANYIAKIPDKNQFETAPISVQYVDQERSLILEMDKRFLSTSESLWLNVYNDGQLERCRRGASTGCFSNIDLLNSKLERREKGEQQILVIPAQRRPIYFELAFKANGESIWEREWLRFSKLRIQFLKFGTIIFNERISAFSAKIGSLEVIPATYVSSDIWWVALATVGNASFSISLAVLILSLIVFWQSRSFSATGTVAISLIGLCLILVGTEPLKTFSTVTSDTTGSRLLLIIFVLVPFAIFLDYHAKPHAFSRAV